MPSRDRRRGAAALIPNGFADERFADERGSAVVTGVLAVGVLIVLTLSVVQGLLVMHVRSIASSAAQDGALAASRRGASMAEGVAAADETLRLAAAGPLQSWTVAPSRAGDRVQITVRGEVVSVVGFGNVGVSVTRGMRAEEFRPQGATP